MSIGRVPVTEGDVRPIQNFEASFVAALPETARLLRSATLTVHPRVRTIVLHGSRGLAGGHRPDSDVDLSLVADTGGLSYGPELATLLREVLKTTLRHWTGPVEADLAAVFDTRGCGLACFAGGAACAEGGVDCFGLYKVQRGFQGFVTNAGIEVERMQPCTVIWRNPKETGFCAT
jgi:hypothetical protein